MIEIIQAGQFGKTSSLVEMHRLRKIIFKDRMGWDVNIVNDQLEIDDYDLPESVYILARDDEGHLAGIWRMLPSTSPSMIRNIWPEFLEDFPMPVADDVWEVSRFGVYSDRSNSKEHIRLVNKITAELIAALTELCVMTGIKHIYTLYHPQVGRSVRKIGFIPEAVTQERLVDGKAAIVGHFLMDEEALGRIRGKTGINCRIEVQDLPPILQDRLGYADDLEEKKAAYA